MLEKFTADLHILAVGNVRIVGDSNQVFTINERLPLFGMGEQSECVSDGEDVRLSYRWTVAAPGLIAEDQFIAAFEASAVVKTRMNLQIEPFSLPLLPNAKYVFSLHLNQTYLGLSYVTVAHVQVAIESTSPVAAITGGSRTVAGSQLLELDGITSYDPDIPKKQWSSGGLFMCWKCFLGTCSGKPCTGVMSTQPCPWAETDAPDNWYVPAEMLVLNAEYHVTLTAMRESELAPFVNADAAATGGVTDKCVIMMDAIATGTVHYDVDRAFLTTPSVAGVPPVSNIIRPVKPKYNPHDSLRLTGFVNSFDVNDTETLLFYEWSISPMPSNWDGILKSEPDGVGRGAVGLSILPGALLEDQTYTISLAVEESGLKSVAFMDVIVNSPPVLGMFKVSPMLGDALSTPFYMEALGWLDADLPVNIMFGFMDHSQEPPLRVPLGAISERIDINTRLPVGDVAAQWKLQVFCEVSDGLGAVRRAPCEASADVADCLVTVNRWGLGMSDLKQTVKLSMASNSVSGDSKKTMAYAALLSLTMKKGVEAAARREEIPDFSVELIASAERALSSSTIDNGFRDQAASSLQAMLPLSQDMLLEYAQTALRIFSILMADHTAAHDKSTADAIVTALSVISQALSKMGKISAAAAAGGRRMGSVDAERREYQRQQEVLFQHLNDVATGAMRQMTPNEIYHHSSQGVEMTAKRLTLTSLSDGNTVVTIVNSPNSQETVRVPDIRELAQQSFARNPGTGGSQALDMVAHVFVDNPYEYMGANATTRGKVVELTFFEALNDEDRAPINITIQNLITPIEIRILVNNVPTASVDVLTGVMRVVGCGVWDTSNDLAQWDSQGITTEQPVQEPLAHLTCKTTHTSTFAAVDMEAGCDESVITPLKKNNKCGVCKERELPMEGLCDWNGIPCEFGTNDCGVCNIDATTEMAIKPYSGAPKGSSTELHLEMRSTTGICDYRGVPCPPVIDPDTGEPEYPVVSVCGLCVGRTENRQGLTVKNEGICDCENSGIPNGGSVVDCCGICKGGNKNLDYCGMIAGICFDGGHAPLNVPCPPGADVCPVPRRIPNSLVCHIGASPFANLSCTGCDGHPRPELPWNAAPPAINMGSGVGGKRNDSCGVCGGDSSTCAGCDGVPNSGLTRDTCRVCGSNGESCSGCDNIPRASAKQEFCVGDTLECSAGSGVRYNCACDYDALTDLVACSPGCDGVAGSGKFFDKCGHCGGDGSLCKGCDGVELSGRVFDAIGRCLRPTKHAPGCDGVPNSHKRNDKCGDCAGDGTRCTGVEIQCPDQSHVPDDCGVCRDPAVPAATDDVTCRGCDGVAFSGKLFDRCRVCDGDGRSCANKLNCTVTPCEFLQRPNYRFENYQRLSIWDRCWIYDSCGICGGDGLSCLPKTVSVSVSNAAAWVNDVSQVVTGIMRVNIDSSTLSDPTRQLQVLQ